MIVRRAGWGHLAAILTGSDTDAPALVIEDVQPHQSQVLRAVTCAVGSNVGRLVFVVAGRIEQERLNAWWSGGQSGAQQITAPLETFGFRVLWSQLSSLGGNVFFKASHEWQWPLGCEAVRVSGGERMSVCVVPLRVTGTTDYGYHALLAYANTDGTPHVEDVASESLPRFPSPPTDTTEHRTEPGP